MQSPAQITLREIALFATGVCIVLGAWLQSPAYGLLALSVMGHVLLVEVARRFGSLAVVRSVYRFLVLATVVVCFPLAILMAALSLTQNTFNASDVRIYRILTLNALFAAALLSHVALLYMGRRTVAIIFGCVGAMLYGGYYGAAMYFGIPPLEWMSQGSDLYDLAFMQLFGACMAWIYGRYVGEPARAA